MAIAMGSFMYILESCVVFEWCKDVEVSLFGDPERHLE